MSSYWPWIAVAGFGALHGLNPATGWMCAATWGVRSSDWRQALWALVPIAVGHTVAIALVAAALAFGLTLDRSLQQALAGALLAIIGAVHWHSRKAGRRSGATGHAGLALWSFIVATAHGAGMMLVPALMPLCFGSASSQQIADTASLWIALAAVGVHTAAMLAVTGGIACLVVQCAGALTNVLKIRGVA